MTLHVPNIDDRTYDQLVAEARALIPKYLPEWTDHNPSDPGITLLELFCFLAESAIYQINRVPEQTYENFAGLLGIKRAFGEDVVQTLKRARDVLFERHRAIIPDDIEHVIKKETGFYLCPAGVKLRHMPKTPVEMMETPVMAANTSQWVSPRSKKVYITLIEGMDIKPGDNVLVGLDLLGECAKVSEVIRTRDTIAIELTATVKFNHNKGTPIWIIDNNASVEKSYLQAPAKEGDMFIAIKKATEAKPPMVVKLVNDRTEEFIYVLGYDIARVKLDVAGEYTEIVIVPDIPGNQSPNPHSAILQKVFDVVRFLSPMASRTRVAKPIYEDICIGITVVRDKASTINSLLLQQRIEDKIIEYFNPLTGGSNGEGWEFGRPVYRSELYRLIEDIDGVDHVKMLRMKKGSEPIFDEDDGLAGELTLLSSSSLVKLPREGLKVEVVDR